MNVIKFDCNGHNAPAYSCNNPGDNSGLYVPKSEADDLLSTLETAHKELVNVKEELGFCRSTLEAIKQCEKTISKARGEQQ